MKKIISLLLLAALTLSMAAGCNANDTKKKPDNSAKEPSDKAAAKDQGLLGEILKDGKMTVALSPDFAPMEFVDTSKQGQEQYVGFDVFLAKYISEQLGIEMEIKPMDFASCQAAVQMKTVDMSISGYSKTDEREKYFTLSDYYYPGDNETNQCILVLKDNLDKYSSAESFKGAKVGAQIASLQLNLLKEQLPDAEAVEVNDLNTGVLQLINGKIDALCVAVGNGRAYIANYDSLALSKWEFTVEDEGNVVLMPKGEDALCEKINEILAKAYKDSMYGTWYEEAQTLSGIDTAKEVTLG